MNVTALGQLYSLYMVGCTAVMDLTALDYHSVGYVSTWHHACGHTDAASLVVVKIWAHMHTSAIDKHSIQSQSSILWWFYIELKTAPN